MDVPSHADVVEQVDSFLARQAMAPSRFGRDALGEPQFVSQLRAGRMPGLVTLTKLSEFMRKHDDDAGSAMASKDRGPRPASHRLNAGAR